MDVTIIIPTLNRSVFINKLFHYYESQNFTGDLIIIDSSAKYDFELNQQRIKKSNLNVIHKKLITDVFYAMKFALPLIKTNYAIHSGDDDYFSVPGIENLIYFLDNNKQFISISGKAFTVSYNTDDNKISGSSLYKIPFSEDKILEKRLNQIKKFTQLPVYSIFRSRDFKTIYNNLLSDPEISIRSRLNFNEYMWKIIPFILGPSTYKDIFLLIRFKTEKIYEIKRLKEINNKDFSKIYKICLQRIKFLIKEEDNLNKNYNIAKNKFESFVNDELNPTFFFKINENLFKIKNIIFYILSRVLNGGNKLHQKILDKKSNQYIKEFEHIINCVLFK